jgi:hypothetical protein
MHEFTFVYQRNRTRVSTRRRDSSKSIATAVRAYKSVTGSSILRIPSRVPAPPSRVVRITIEAGALPPAPRRANAFAVDGEGESRWGPAPHPAPNDSFRPGTGQDQGGRPRLPPPSSDAGPGMRRSSTSRPWLAAGDKPAGRNRRSRGPLHRSDGTRNSCHAF